MIRVGVIGLGHWGPNLVRNFSKLKNAELVAVCDKDNDRLNHISSQFPNIFATNNHEKIFNRDLIDAIVISTPTNTHYNLARKSLDIGIHTFVEKPLSTSVKECKDLNELALKNNIILCVGHIFLYNAAVNKLKELINDDVIGNIVYIIASRFNLGPIRYDVNTLWDLASHDISIVLYLINSKPVSVNCQGLAYLNNDIHDVCSITIQFENGSMALINASWLHPNKIRQMTIVGDKKMADYNDMESIDKIKIYDKGVEKLSYSKDLNKNIFSLRNGEIFNPKIDEVEPLKTECQHFINCIKERKQPKTDGQNGIDVVEVLEAAEKSLKKGGEKINI
jgi:predicted dehydrogenase